MSLPNTWMGEKGMHEVHTALIQPVAEVSLHELLCEGLVRRVRWNRHSERGDVWIADHAGFRLPHADLSFIRVVLFQ